MSTPLYDALTRHLSKGRLSCHTPGHKGQAALLAPLTALPFDLTDLPDTGSLYDGGGAIEAAERETAAAFGAADTLFSGGGCTLAIQAMLCLASRRGRTILMARNAHRSAVHAAALLDLHIIWLCDLSKTAVEAAFAAHPDARSLYITSPDYAGRLADIPALHAVCRRLNAALLVDNAHGSHLGAFDLHPLALGADLTADSAHKTLPVLTGGACLHVARGGLFDGTPRQELKATMALFGSTSPAFPVLASLDLMQQWWTTEGQEAFRLLETRLQPLKTQIAEAGLSPAFDRCDPVRLTLDCHDRSATAAAERLRESGIEPEYADSRFVVLLLSPFHTDEQLAHLQNAIAAIPLDTLPPGTPSPFSLGLPTALPEQAIPLRDAALAPCDVVDTASAVGRIAAESICPCPPGVAAAVPGERLDNLLIRRLLAAGIDRVTVVR